MRVNRRRRFARPPLGATARERFSEWLAKDFQGSMGYLERRRVERLSPGLLLGDLRGVIVLGHPYDCGLPNTEAPEAGNVSRYAWGRDYHDVLGEKLRDFQAWLRARRPPTKRRSQRLPGPASGPASPSRSPDADRAC